MEEEWEKEEAEPPTSEKKSEAAARLTRTRSGLSLSEKKNNRCEKELKKTLTRTRSGVAPSKKSSKDPAEEKRSKRPTNGRKRRAAEAGEEKSKRMWT